MVSPLVVVAAFLALFMVYLAQCTERVPVFCVAATGAARRRSSRRRRARRRLDRLSS